MNKKKVWFVTGASKGLGLALVKKLLAAGYAVAATSRKLDNLQQAVGAQTNSQWLPLQVDLSDKADVDQAVEDTINYFGKLDVVVNNAGYGVTGALEETSEAQIAQNFEVNVMAVIRVMKATLPYFRRQRSGHIFNIASIGGFVVPAGWPVYGAAKFAVMGLSEGVAEEVKEFGIHVTAVAPGGFRTEFLGDSVAYAEQKIDEYTAVRNSQAKYGEANGKQPGNPDAAADLFIRLAEEPNPPVRIFLGSDAYTRAKAKAELLSSEIERNKNVSGLTDYQP